MRIRSAVDRVVTRLSATEHLDTANDRIATVSDRLQRLPSLPVGWHRRLVWLPLGAWGTAKLCDLLDRPGPARTMIGVGVLAAVPTLFSGHEDWRVADAETRRVATVHAALNNLAVYGFAASWLVRGRGHHRAGVAVSWGSGLPLAVAVVLGLGMRDLGSTPPP